MSLKITTEAEKAFLALFNEITPTKANDTKSKKERRAEFERSYGAITPTSEIAAKIAAAERVVWVPCGYVLFLRQTTCKHCAATERCLDFPRLFLQQRKQRGDASHPYLYTPVSGIEFKQLPRRKIINISTTPYCLSCFEGSSSCESSYFLPQADMQLLTDELEKFSPELRQGLLHEAALVYSLKPASQPYTSEVAFGGSPSETEFGGESANEGFARNATAEG